MNLRPPRPERGALPHALRVRITILNGEGSCPAHPRFTTTTADNNSKLLDRQFAEKLKLQSGGGAAALVKRQKNDMADGLRCRALRLARFEGQLRARRYAFLAHCQDHGNGDVSSGDRGEVHDLLLAQ